ncbi:MAG: Flp pilus assembly protein CpaB, partial [Solirubrobacterales bacterium]|nr:Flp pilus assembly protein CpaB [Solirubrobacterales bacterium]
PSRLLQTRRGAIAVAVVAGLVALTVLLAFMANYRDSVRSDAESTRVLVADRQLDSGTAGDAIAEAGLYRTIEVRGDEAADGAFADPDALRGKHATTTIYSGQQLAAADFAAGVSPVAGRLVGTDRALSVPVDAAHGNIGRVRTGSKVDVLGGFNAEQSGGRARPVLDILARDVLVLEAPDKSASGSGVGGGKAREVVLRLSDREATRVAFASDQGNVWLTIRPPTLAKDSKINTVEAGSLLGLGSIPTRGGGR